ncbi:hypothetical protein AB0J52_03755 [Spirillospora sp. NPDC049652]
MADSPQSDSIHDQIKTRRTPGIPGLIGDLQWVDSTDFGGEPEDRRIMSMYDIDPAPLARLLATYLGILDGDVTDRMREIADDDRDGPIHMVHLLGACEYAARNTSGGLPSPATPGVPSPTALLVAATSGGALPALVNALHQGGFPAATRAARPMDPDTRHHVLDSLLQYWGAPITGLCFDLTDERLRRPNK